MIFQATYFKIYLWAYCCCNIIAMYYSVGKNHLVINPRVFFYLTTVVQFLSVASVFYVKICFILESVGICAENFQFYAQSPLLVNFTQWCVGGARYLCSTHAQPDRRTPRIKKYSRILRLKNAHKKYSNLEMLKSRSKVSIYK